MKNNNPYLLDENTANIIIDYYSACRNLVAHFCQKQDIVFDYWIGNCVGGSASFIEQYVFSMDDILLDISTNQPVGLILKWQDESVTAHIENSESEVANMNYKSYTMGLRISHLNE
jgi:hypothetical protein